MRIAAWLLVYGLLSPALSRAEGNFPGDSDHARPECRVSGGWLRLRLCENPLLDVAY